MAIIGATQLEPTNVLGSYAQGMEIGRANRLARTQEAAAMRDMQEKAALRNMLTSATEKDLADPAFLNRLAVTPGGAPVAQSLSQAMAAQRTAKKTDLEIKAEERKQLRETLNNTMSLLRGAIKDPSSYGTRLKLAADMGYDVSRFPQAFDPASTPKLIQAYVDELTPLEKQFDEEERVRVENERQFQRRLSTSNLQLRRGELQLQREKFDREGDFQYLGRVEQMKAAAQFTGKALAQAQAELPGAIDQANTTLALLDDMIGKPQKVDKNGKVIEEGTAPHPGFVDAVGATWRPGARLIPGTDAAGFQAMYDQATGTAFLQAYDTLRGGGAIANEEGKRATAAITRMNLAQSEKEFIKAGREFQEIIRNGVRKAEEKARLGGQAPATLSTEDQQALNWANSNPTDPRAAEIKARLGVR
jgi:hypothetical protein